MQILTVPTQPFQDQKPGTAGLRKRVAVFRQAHYLENFLQSVFDCCPQLSGGTLVIGGDGRYYNREAAIVLLRMAAANGVRRAVLGRGGLLSTPAASLLIPQLGARGGFILTASHNPAGPEGDFGIKFNLDNGGQAPEALTERFYRRSLEIERYRIAAESPALNMDSLGACDFGPLRIEVLDPVAHYADYLERLFDFDLIRARLRGGLRMYFDALNAVTGPYAVEILERRLGAPQGTVLHREPLPDFGGRHPDPNPHDAAQFVQRFLRRGAPDFGAASDGDGDRNMILGAGIAVSPGDSLAVLAANARLLPGYRAGLMGVARSLPTSHAVDRVAAKLGIPCYETPTGWRFFASLLDAGRITLCGEESFGTGGNHAREKDGLWAVLFWLNLLAVRRQSVLDILRQHWAEYGRDYFQREDYFLAETRQAAELMRALQARLAALPGRPLDGMAVSAAGDFTYRDPVDGSVSRNQGLRVEFGGQARIVYRLSGTGTEGAILRVYLERYEPDAARQQQSVAGVLAPLSRLARRLAGLRKRPMRVT